MRWSAIEEARAGPIIYCWSLVDACQLIQQHGPPHHLDWPILHADTYQQGPHQVHGLSHHRGAAGSGSSSKKGISHLKEICICVPSASLGGSYSGFVDWWGDPAEQLLSPQAWSEMLGEMSCQWRVSADRLEVKWDKSCVISVKGLLDALLLVDTQNHLEQLLLMQEGGLIEVNIYKDNIRDVLEWSSQHQSQLRVVKVTFPNVNSSIFPGDKALMRKASEYG